MSPTPDPVYRAGQVGFEIGWRDSNWYKFPSQIPMFLEKEQEALLLDDYQGK